MLRMDIHDFLSRVSTLMLTRDIDVAILSVDSVRPSVRPYNTLVLYDTTYHIRYRHSFFHHTVAQSYSFTSIKQKKIPTMSPRAGALNRGGV